LIFAILERNKCRPSQPSQEKQWAREKLTNINNILEALGIGEIQIIDRNGIKLGVAGHVEDSVLDILSKAFPDRPQDANNCYDVAEYLQYTQPDFDSISSRVKGHIVNGNHCINFGNRLLVDMSISSYMGKMFDVLVIALPDVLPARTDSYTALATKVYGGDWNYLGKAGHDELRKKKQEDIDAAEERIRRIRREKSLVGSFSKTVKSFFR
jgi:hypothetical protein